MVLAVKARAMLSAAQVPKEECYKLWRETVVTATALDNLIPVMWNGETKTRYEHAGHDVPTFVKHLRTFGESGIVKIMKDGKVSDRGTTMKFVGFAQEHAGNCYRIDNPVTLGVSDTGDIIWMGCMYFTSENCEKTKVLPVIVVPITNDTSNKDLAVTEVIKVALLNSIGGEGIDMVAETPNSLSKEGWVTVTKKKGNKSIPTGWYDPVSGKTVKWSVTAIDVTSHIMVLRTCVQRHSIKIST
jgi:hypothetical protein